MPGQSRRPRSGAVHAGAPSPRLIGIPWDASSSYKRGAAAAPPLVRQALRSDAGNPFTERLTSIAGLSDAGELSLPPDPADARAAIERAVAAILADGLRPLSIGGDHSVTYPIVRAVGRALGPVTILHVDAHPDLYDAYDGDRYSHACPFARIMEEGLASRLVQVGIRAMNDHGRDQAERFGVEVIDMRAWQSGTRPDVSGNVYLSIDLDGLDPAFAPGVAHPEPGGLMTREVVDLIHDTGGTLVGADIVEYNPGEDIGGVTATVAAKLVKEVAGRMLAATPR